jgi:SAM-dependent methyltransferase
VGTSAHWNRIYAARPSQELGWYESEPSTLELVTANSTRADSVIDVGGGDSRLVDELLDRGYRDITVLDLSDVALRRTRERLGDRAESVEWIHADVTGFAPLRTWDVWHDRALFHFLVSDDERDAYCEVASRAVEPGGRLIVAAFSTEGPDHCAGLPVHRFDTDSLAAAFGPDFEAVTITHIIPQRSIEADQRPYVAAVFTRRGPGGELT